MRVAIFGNSGSGKSTLAKRLAHENGLPLLELDTIVWEPGKIAVVRAENAIRDDLSHFLSTHEHWIVEGCYAELIAMTASYEPEFVFLNPGVEVCTGNNRARPWEPQKYATKEAQDEMLGNLLAWVEDYYRRDDPWSLAAHRRLFDAYAGPKREVTDPIALDTFVALR
jgi:adenylate kinase family enzyme